MSEAKHTPGPWVVDQEVNEGDDGLFFVVLADDGAVTVAAPPTEADARLIAAAPDLLSACQSAEMALLGFLRHNLVIDAALDCVRSAIRKATHRPLS